MAWQELSPTPPELSVKTDGKIEWNTALQLAMGDPTWVDLMWDADNRYLGLRAVNSATGLPVAKEPQSSEYKIDSADILSDAGVTVAQNVSATPDTWVEGSVPNPTVPGTWFGYNAIHYIELPAP